MTYLFLNSIIHFFITMFPPFLFPDQIELFIIVDFYFLKKKVYCLTAREKFILRNFDYVPLIFLSRKTSQFIFLTLTRKRTLIL